MSRPPRRGNISLWEHPAEEWISHFCLFNGIAGDRRATMERILANIVPTGAYMALRDGQETVAVGLAVQEQEYIGLFDIATAPRWRGKGLGTVLVASLLHWGRQHGARHAYLQVMTDNAPAIALYQKFNFSEVYRYWYRIKSCSDVSGALEKVMPRDLPPDSAGPLALSYPIRENCVLAMARRSWYKEHGIM